MFPWYSSCMPHWQASHVPLSVNTPHMISHAFYAHSIWLCYVRTYPSLTMNSEYIIYHHVVIRYIINHYICTIYHIHFPLPWWSWTLLLSCKFLAMGTLLSIMNAYKLLWTMKDWVYLAKLLANGIEIKLQNKVYWSACSMHAHTGDLLSSFPCYIQCIALGIYIKTCPAMRQDAILKNEGDCFKHIDPIRIYHSMMDTSLTLCLQLYVLYSCLCTIKHAAFRIMFS